MASNTYNMRFAWLLCLLLFATNAKAQTAGCGRLYVDSAKTISGNGSSWATAFKTVSQALDSANRGTCSSREIWVAKGTYYPMSGATTIAGNRDSSFRVLRNGIKIYGGFAGGETALSARNIALNTTTLSGDIGVAGDSTDNSYHVVTVVSNYTIDTNTRIDGFSVKRGNAEGAGVFSIAGSSVIRVNGGGICNIASSPFIANCTVSSNSSYTGKGGGIYNSGSSPVIDNCTLSFNRNSFSFGGGMYNDYSSPLIKNCTFSSNTSVYGGGLHNQYSSPSLNNCTFSANQCSSSGGGIYNNTSSSTSITNCTFSSNTSSTYGGGIYVGGGSTVALTNCTFFGNNSSGSGGGIYNDASNVLIANCIIWGNLSSNGNSIYSSYSGPNPVISYTIAESPQPGTGNSTANPLFVSPYNAIGPDGIWRTADDGLRLQSGSPAVNTGSNTAVPASITTDIMGTQRIQQSTVDRGAYESGFFTCPTGAVVYVDSSKATTGNGSSWNSAYKSLSEGLQAANNCAAVTQVWVAKGTYYPMNGVTAVATSRDSSFRIFRNGIKVYGGFAGTETTLSARNIALNTTTLSGDIGIIGDSTDNSYHVVVITAATTGIIDSTTRIDGFTITKGNANGPGVFPPAPSTTPRAQSAGGGFLIGATAPSIANCTITRNTGINGGGMSNITTMYTPPIITACTFTHNTATVQGGAMHSANSSPVISKCVFVFNSAPIGGGIGDQSSGCKITNSIFCYNSASTYGGAINASGAKLTNSVFFGNSSPAGSGIYNSDNGTVVANCIVWGNTGGLAFAQAPSAGASVNATTTTNPLPVRVGSGNSTADPLFINAANPIGPDGIWGTVDDGLRLTNCSPAVNTGNNVSVPAGTTTDITGAVRIQNTFVDRGPYEMPSTATGVSDTYVYGLPVGPVCSYTPITFTAFTYTPGTVPVYQWYRNGVAVGTNQTTYTASGWAGNATDSVWVVHTNNNCNITDTSNKAAVPLEDTLPAPTFLTGNATPCPGYQVYYIQGQHSNAFTWTVPAGWTITTGQGSNVIEVNSTTAAGTVSVTANNSCGVPSVPTTMAVVPVAAPAAPAVPNGPLAVCPSSSNTYSTTAVAGASTYTWSVPAGWTITAGQGTGSVTVTAAAGSSSGNISVIAVSSCQQNSPAATLAVTGGPLPPTVVIFKNTGDTICAGTVVTFTATATLGGTAPAYQWKKNGVNVGTNSPSYSSSTLVGGDVVSVALTSNAACASMPMVTATTNAITISPTLTPTLTVTANPGLSVPAGSTVTFTATVSAGSANATYQWAKNGNTVPGATGSAYSTSTLAGGDLITARVAGLGPCAVPNILTSAPLRMSDPAGIQSVSSGGNWQQNLLLHPNPNSGHFRVSADWGTISAGEKVQVEVVNNLGQSVFRKEMVLTAGKWDIEVQLPESVSNGLYMLRVNRRKDGSMATKPVLIQR